MNASTAEVLDPAGIHQESAPDLSKSAQRPEAADREPSGWSGGVEFDPQPAWAQAAIEPETSCDQMAAPVGEGFPAGAARPSSVISVDFETGDPFESKEWRIEEANRRLNVIETFEKLITPAEQGGRGLSKAAAVKAVGKGYATIWRWLLSAWGRAERDAVCGVDRDNVRAIRERASDGQFSSSFGEFSPRCATESSAEVYNQFDADSHCADERGVCRAAITSFRSEPDGASDVHRAIGNCGLCCAAQRTV